MMRWWVISEFCVLACSAGHFGSPPCGADELQGEVQGASGFACVKKCDDGTLACPTDVPAGTTAQPQCMLADVDQGAFCALFCEMDAQCPSNTRCRTIKDVNVGVCLTTVSFADWASNSQTRKLIYSLPTNRPGQQSPQNYAIAKTYASLQSLKSRYSIDDGDADMLILKELLSSIAASTGKAGPGNTASAAVPSSFSPSQISDEMINDMRTGNLADLKKLGESGQVSFANTPWRETNRGLPTDEKAAVEIMKHDGAYLEKTVGGGAEGFKRLGADTLWSVEHMGEMGVSCELLRGLFIVAVLYIGVGSFIRYQAMGQTGWDAVPHVGFWSDYPNLVCDGFVYAKMLVGMQPPMSSASASSSDLLGPTSGGRGGSGGFEAMT